MNGRHFLLLGILGCAGLVSVHDGQRQVDACYKIAAMEKELRGVRDEIELNKMKHRALQSPRAISTKTQELQLKVGPAIPLQPAPETPAPRIQNPPQRSLGGERRF